MVPSGRKLGNRSTAKMVNNVRAAGAGRDSTNDLQEPAHGHSRRCTDRVHRDHPREHIRRRICVPGPQ
jgi:hypothetical protein